jgi:hypothetical protein
MHAAIRILFSLEKAADHGDVAGPGQARRHVGSRTKKTGWDRERYVPTRFDTEPSAQSIFHGSAPLDVRKRTDLFDFTE